MQTNPASSRQPIKLTLRSLGLIGLLGGLGGAIAFSSYDMLAFGYSAPPSWDVAVVGAIQGLLLAGLSAGWVTFFSKYQSTVRWIGAPLVGWSSGWISYTPVEFLFGTESTAVENARVAILWPFADHVGFYFPVQPLYGLLAPFFNFGFVALIFYALYSCSQLPRTKLWFPMLIGLVSGSIGSVFVSGATKQYSPLFGVLYGVMWGSLVGFGIWKSQKTADRS